MVLTTDDKLGAGDNTSRRVVVKTHIERKADPQDSSRKRTKPATQEWKITALEPVDVFKSHSAVSIGMASGGSIKKSSSAMRAMRGAN